MIEGVTRARGLLSLASEMGYDGLPNVIRLGTDSSAAKCFVCRRVLGRMRHLEIRDLWLQKEVREGKGLVHTVPGTSNPADLMTKGFTDPAKWNHAISLVGLRILPKVLHITHDDFLSAFITWKTSFVLMR